MKVDVLRLLRCPRSDQRLKIVDRLDEGGRIKSGWLVSEDGHNRYPIRNFIPRFVPESNYADSFGMQWNRFRKTQLDSYSGHPISAGRFWKATGWTPHDVTGQWVLDIGCGAGRFAEVALDAGARVVAVDYSGAVDACYANLKDHPDLHVVQGDIYALPFHPGTFPFVYSLGVLQHTPDVERAFATLPRMVAPGGSLCVDFYEKSWKSLLRPKYWLRPITKRISKARLFAILEWLVPRLLPASRVVGTLPVIGNALRQAIPVANYFNVLPLNEEQQLEWSLLDTFDWFSPEYDNPQKSETVRRWLEQSGLQNVQVSRAGHLVARGTKPLVAVR